MFQQTCCRELNHMQVVQLTIICKLPLIKLSMNQQVFHLTLALQRRSNQTSMVKFTCIMLEKLVSMTRSAECSKLSLLRTTSSETKTTCWLAETTNSSRLLNTSNLGKLMFIGNSTNLRLLPLSWPIFKDNLPIIKLMRPAGDNRLISNQTSTINFWLNSTNTKTPTASLPHNCLLSNKKMLDWLEILKG